MTKSPTVRPRFHRRNRRAAGGFRLLILAGAVLLACGAARAQAAPQTQADLSNSFWGFHLEEFFGEKKPINLYMVRRDGKWIAGLATATNYRNGKAVWNTALQIIEPIDLNVGKDKVTGKVTVTFVPDPWVPADQKPRTAVITLDAPVSPSQDPNSFGTVSGTWKSTIAGEDTELAAARLRPSASGEIVGYAKPAETADLSDASYDLVVYDLLPGQTKENFQRRRGLSIGVKDGKVVSARLAQMDLRHFAYDHQIIDAPSDFQVAPDTLGGTVTFGTGTLDGEPAQFSLTFSGKRVAQFVVGTWKGTVAVADGKPKEISGFFRGTVGKGAFVSEMAKDDRPWFLQVKDFKPVQPGEHPRLFFRKGDLPELKRRSETPEGKKIMARLRQLLNGSDGESMPTSYNPATQAYEKNNFKARSGAYSISHAAGYGFLYQITGDRKYADFARQCVEKAFAGQRCFDDRYSWVAPGGELRAGPSVGWTAVAYDLCYDAWDADFRQKVALAIQNYSDQKGGEWNNPEGITLRKMVLTPKQGPGSNHFGAVGGGCGLAVLAIKGDPGSDKELLDRYSEALEKQVVRHVTAGWGDGGYYKEGWGASTVGTQGGFLCFLQALKTAAGHDYLNVERPNASYVTMVPRSLMLIGPPAVLPYRSNMGGTYGSSEFHRERGGFSHGGHFSEGFGAVADRYKPALLWTYNHTVEPDPAKRDFDTPSLYPHRAMLALINWPTFAGIQEKDPAELLPRTSVDHLYDYFVFRNRWQDKDDIVTTVLIRPPDGTKPREVMVWGLGLRLGFGEPEKMAKVTHYQAGKDGSGVLTAGKFALAVDYSRTGGADALVVSVGTTVKGEPASDKAKLSTVTAGATTFNVLTLSSAGQHPQPKADGDKLVVGGQTVTFADGKLTLAKFEALK